MDPFHVRIVRAFDRRTLIFIELHRTAKTSFKGGPELEDRLSCAPFAPAACRSLHAFLRHVAACPHDSSFSALTDEFAVLSGQPDFLSQLLGPPDDEGYSPFMVLCSAPEPEGEKLSFLLDLLRRTVTAAARALGCSEATAAFELAVRKTYPGNGMNALHVLAFCRSFEMLRYLTDLFLSGPSDTGRKLVARALSVPIGLPGTTLAQLESRMARKCGVPRGGVLPARYGDTLLHIAVSAPNSMDTRLLRQLCELPVRLDPFVRNAFGTNVLTAASAAGNVPALLYLTGQLTARLARYPSERLGKLFVERDALGRSVLQELAGLVLRSAAAPEDFEIVAEAAKRLLRNDPANGALLRRDLHRFLWKSCDLRFEPFCRTLLGMGLDPSEWRDPETLRTPMEAAAGRKHLGPDPKGTVRLCLEHLALISPDRARTEGENLRETADGPTADFIGTFLDELGGPEVEETVSET